MLECQPSDTLEVRSLHLSGRASTGWIAITKGPNQKEEHHNIFQVALSDLARSPGAATTAALLTISKDLHVTIMILMFWSGDPDRLDRLDERLHPFHTVYTSIANTSMEQTNLQTYDLLANDGHLDLQDTSQSDWPTSYLVGYIE